MGTFVFTLVILTAAFFTWPKRKFGWVSGILLGPVTLLFGYLFFYWMIGKLFSPTLEVTDVPSALRLIIREIVVD